MRAFAIFIFFLFSLNICFGQCSPAPDVGTNVTWVGGNSIDDNILCWQDTLFIISNDDFVLPPNGCGSCASTLGYLIYNSSGPTAGVEPRNDPNLHKLDDFYTKDVGVLAPGRPNFNIANNPLFSSFFTIPTQNRTWCYVPVTADDGQNGITHAGTTDSNNDEDYDKNGDGCYELGTPVCVAYLKEITFNNQESCSGTSVDITISGGSPEFFAGNYTITNTGSGTLSSTTTTHGGTVSITGLTAGQSYSIEVVDDNGCPAMTSGGPVSGGGGIDPTIAEVDSFCVSSADTLLTAGSPGGTWSGPGVNASGVFSPSTAGCGTHTITYEIVNGGCTDKDTEEITVLCPSIDSTDITHVSCNSVLGICDGEVKIYATGASEYSIDNGSNWQISNTFNMLCAGNYQIKTRNSKGCESTGNITITQPSVPLSATVVVTNPSCFGLTDGSGAVVPNGGTAPYTYQWDAATGNQTDSIATNIGDGNYSITVTDKNNCTATESTTLTQPSVLNVNIVTTNASCFGLCDGNAIADTSGGTQPVSVQWDAGTNPTNISNTSLCAGTYQVTATDNNGCTTTDNTVIQQPDSIAVYTSSTLSTCGKPDGSVTIDSIIGGTVPYTIQWDASAGNSIDSTVLNLTDGCYTVVVTDNSNCTNSAPITECIGATAGPLVNSLDGISTTCYDSSDGSASITINGGTAPYSYNWGPVFPDANSINNLSAGTYSVTITDNDLCEIDTFVVISEPTEVVVNIDDNGGWVICHGESVTYSAIGGGGNSPHTFLWNDLTLGTELIDTPLKDSVYSVIAIDANGCKSLPQTATFSFHPQLVASITSSNDTICAGDNVTLTVAPQGGTGAGYTYSWIPTSETTSSITHTPGESFPDSAQYTVEIDGGCPAKITERITVYFYEEPPITISSDGASACPPVTVNFSNNTPNVNAVMWDFGNGPVAGNSTVQKFSESGCIDVTISMTTSKGCPIDSVFSCIATVLEQPSADFSYGPQPTTTFFPEITFNDISTGNITKSEWDFMPDKVEGETVVYEFPNESGTYPVQLVVTSADGCTDTIVQTVIISEEFSFYIPNAFIPDGDGVNDFFHPIGMSLAEKNFEFLIYDRWGTLVFEAFRPEKKWDGTDLSGEEVAQGVYPWIIKVASSVNGEQKQYQGIVTLIR